MGKSRDREFTDRLNGLSKRNLLLMANKMTDNNPNSSHLVWFANNVDLFQFEGHEGFQLQGYHLPSIFSRATGNPYSYLFYHQSISLFSHRPLHLSIYPSIYL
jgi:hypothetical protein